jgi:hypothetical protein
VNSDVFFDGSNAVTYLPLAPPLPEIGTVIVNLSIIPISSVDVAGRNLPIGFQECKCKKPKTIGKELKPAASLNGDIARAATSCCPNVRGCRISASSQCSVAWSLVLYLPMPAHAYSLRSGASIGLTTWFDVEPEGSCRWRPAAAAARLAECPRLRSTSGRCDASTFPQLVLVSLAWRRPSPAPPTSLPPPMLLSQKSMPAWSRPRAASPVGRKLWRRPSVVTVSHSGGNHAPFYVSAVVSAVVVRLGSSRAFTLKTVDLPFIRSLFILLSHRPSRLLLLVAAGDEQYGGRGAAFPSSKLVN